jgi:hypothetical protein
MSSTGGWKITAETPIGPQESIGYFRRGGCDTDWRRKTSGATGEVYDGSVDDDSAACDVMVKVAAASVTYWDVKYRIGPHPGDATVTTGPPSPKFHGDRGNLSPRTSVEVFVVLAQHRRGVDELLIGRVDARFVGVHSLVGDL